MGWQAVTVTFKLTRSIRQGCPLAPFLYLFIADSLGHLLENQSVEGLKFSESKDSVTNQEFVDDTNLYLVGTLANLNRAKEALELFAIALGSKMNRHKSNTI